MPVLHCVMPVFMRRIRNTCQMSLMSRASISSPVLSPSANLSDRVQLLNFEQGPDEARYRVAGNNEQRSWRYLNYHQRMIDRREALAISGYFVILFATYCGQKGIDWIKGARQYCC